MTPKEKAIELYNKYEVLGKDFTRGVSMKEFSKECALIAVDEILHTAPMMHKEDFDSGDLTIKEFYQEVKQEIEKL